MALSGTTEKPINISDTPRAKITLAWAVDVDRGGNMIAVLPAFAEGKIICDNVVAYNHPHGGKFSSGILVQITGKSELLGQFIVPIDCLHGETWPGTLQ